MYAIWEHLSTSTVAVCLFFLFILETFYSLLASKFQVIHIARAVLYTWQHFAPSAAAVASVMSVIFHFQTPRLFHRRWWRTFGSSEWLNLMNSCQVDSTIKFFIKCLARLINSLHEMNAPTHGTGAEHQRYRRIMTVSLSLIDSMHIPESNSTCRTASVSSGTSTSDEDL